MKYIKKLDPINLTTLQDEPIKTQDGTTLTVKVDDFILQRIHDNKFGASFDALMSASQIKKAVDNSAGETYIALETKDWETLVGIIKEPSTPYNASIAHCLVPVINAVLEAKDDKEN